MQHPSWNLTGDKTRSAAGQRHRALAKEFDAWAAAGRGHDMEQGHMPTARQALERFDAQNIRLFLDLGCGNGYAVRALARKLPAGAAAIGLDLAHRMVQDARETQKAMDEQKKNAYARTGFLRGAFHRIPLQDAQADAVFTHEAIYYAPDVTATLQEVHRVLAPGGRFIATMDHFEENEYSHDWAQYTGLPLTRDSEEGWKNRLKDAGFTQVESRRLLDPDPPVSEAPEKAAGEQEKKRHAMRERWRHVEGTLMVSGRGAGT